MFCQNSLMNFPKDENTVGDCQPIYLSLVPVGWQGGHSLSHLTAKVAALPVQWVLYGISGLPGKIHLIEVYHHAGTRVERPHTAVHISYCGLPPSRLESILCLASIVVVSK